MGKHTKGPWRVIDVETQGYGDPMYVSHEVECVAGLVVASVIHDGIDEHLSNAQLIAAAPDLLDELQSLLTELEKYQNTPHPQGSDGAREYLVKIMHAKHAIARAKGEK